jgi:hypothetical protein
MPRGIVRGHQLHCRLHPRQSSRCRAGTGGTPIRSPRVDPDYPQAAVDARLQGVVILETVVGEDGRVIDVFREFSEPDYVLLAAGTLLSSVALMRVASTT